MSQVSSIASKRFCYYKVFVFLIVVIAITTYIVPMRSWKNTMYLPSQLIRHQAFFKGILSSSTIEELLLNSSRQVKVEAVNCAAIFKGSGNETVAAKSMIRNVSSPLSDSFYLNLTKNCDNFQKQRGYIMSSLTDEEAQFPLAYSMLVYKGSEMAERLLRAIYRPHNFYCIHVDLKASNTTFQTISVIVNCFPNVFLATKRSSVIWGSYTVLEPEITCMKDLWEFQQWKYFINLTGQEFPLKTNYELVKILNVYNGAVDVISSIRELFSHRFRSKKAPYGLRIVKGPVHVVVNRAFVDFILHSDVAKSLLGWLMTTTDVPDETFFAMLNANPQLGINGTYKGFPDTPGRESFARFKNWGGVPCAGRRVRQICILTTGDLPLLGQSDRMFANKFYLEEDRVVIGCLEEKIFNDTRDEYMGTKTFNTAPYQNAGFIKNKV